MLTCAPARLVCSRNALISQINPDNIPPSCKNQISYINFICALCTGCHDSCATCSRPVSQAHCLTCSQSLTLRGEAPGMCTADDTCGSGTFLDTSGNCVGKQLYNTYIHIYI